MSSQRFAPEFKDEAVRQVVERGYPVAEVAQRLGFTAMRSRPIVGPDFVASGSQDLLA